MPDILRHDILSHFTCLRDQCPDTCCQGWSMQVEEATLAHYQHHAPELLAAVETDGNGAWIMRKNSQAGTCVKLEDGLCGIQKQYGETMLGDACYFYPRITRMLGEQPVMTASLSCPEIARLALYANIDFSSKYETGYLPRMLRNVLPEGLRVQEALAVHQAFIDATNIESISAEHAFLRIASASRSLERIDRARWPVMAAYYLAHADARLPKALPMAADPFNILHALAGLMIAVKKPVSAQLQQTVDALEQALCVTLDWKKATIYLTDNSLPAFQNIVAGWPQQEQHCTPLLKRWLAMQLSMALHPFAGLGTSMQERITFIGVRLATLKLALMCSASLHGVLSEEIILRIVQSLSRFLDHLSDPTFSLQIYAETGWIHENRMRGLLLS